MDVGSATNQALIGMQRSQSEMASSAQDIAELNTGNNDVSASQPVSSLEVVEPLMNIEAQQQVFDSSARVVEAENENLGRMIDTMA